MRDVHGAWVWYELLTGDTAGAKAFYEAVVDWSVTPGTEPPMFYGSIEAPDGAMIGGIMPITDEMAAGGARPTWLGYIAVDAIDAAVAKAVGLGAKVLMPRVDMEGVGSFAMIADPDGAPLYLMEPKPTGDYGPSTAFSVMPAGPSRSTPRCSTGRCPRRWTWGRWANTSSSHAPMAPAARRPLARS